MCNKPTLKCNAYAYYIIQYIIYHIKVMRQKIAKIGVLVCLLVGQSVHHFGLDLNISTTM